MVRAFLPFKIVQGAPMKKLCWHLLVILLFGSAGLGSVRAQSQASEWEEGMEWRSLSVPEFGTRVLFPATIFSVSAGRSEKGVGRRFRTSDGRAVLSVYAQANEAGEGPMSYLRSNLQRPRSNLHYQRITRSFFAISEQNNGRIYYSRCNFSFNGPIHCLDLTYPAREKRAWDGVVTRISRSLRPLHG